MTLVQRFKTDTVNVVRSKTGGGYDDDTGMFNQGKKELIEMIVAINPLTGRELVNIPEAQRTSGAINVYSDFVLFTANESAAKTADCIEWRGCSYQIQKVEDWTNTDLPHYKSLAVKVENESNDRTVIG